MKAKDGDTVKKMILLLVAVMLLTACGQDKENDREATYMNITAEKAKQIMDMEEGYIILDVRTQEEYDEGHIPGAILIPNTEIEDRAEDELTDKNQLILVYCRSGRRSKLAAEILVDLGYTNIREFGGIIDWPYEVE
jgi:rhodanese-related sulfurtransferase